MGNNKDVVEEAKALVNAHLAIWGEADPAKRVQLSEGAYTEDVQAIDPGIILNGRKEISDFIGNLLSQYPGFEFAMVKEIETHHDSAITSWQFGPAENPDKITGHDIFTIANGKISKLLVFVNGATSLFGHTLGAPPKLHDTLIS